MELLEMNLFSGLTNITSIGAYFFYPFIILKIKLFINHLVPHIQKKLKHKNQLNFLT
jgi:hypothetical protein